MDTSSAPSRPTLKQSSRSRRKSKAPSNHLNRNTEGNEDPQWYRTRLDSRGSSEALHFSDPFDERGRFMFDNTNAHSFSGLDAPPIETHVDTTSNNGTWLTVNKFYLDASIVEDEFEDEDWIEMDRPQQRTIVPVISSNRDTAARSANSLPEINFNQLFPVQSATNDDFGWLNTQAAQKGSDIHSYEGNAPIPLAVPRMANILRGLRNHESGLPDRDAMRVDARLAAQVGSRTGALRRNSLLFAFFGDSRLFTLREWSSLMDWKE